MNVAIETTATRHAAPGLAIKVTALLCGCHGCSVPRPIRDDHAVAHFPPHESLKATDRPFSLMPG